MKLQLADGLGLPADEAITQKYGFIGRSGSGKSYAAMRLAGGKIGGAEGRLHRPTAPNHNPAIGGRAAMADDHFNVVDLKRRLLAGSQPNQAGCWMWQASTKNGYGQISVNGRSTYTHVLAYRVFVGPIAEGMHVCHRCDEPRCSNPAHLFLGTPADNLKDMRDKGRGHRPPVHRGEEHHEAFLTDAQVVQIRAHASGGMTQRAIAALFGCCQATVSSIVRCEYRKDAK